jgi:hypothetical protein
MRRLLLVVLAASCGDDTGPPDARGFDGPPAGGRISLSWTIEDPDGAPLTCADVGTSFVSLTMVPDGQPFGVTDVIECAAGEGESRLLAPDSYRVTVALAGVESEEVELNDVVVEVDQTTPAGDVVFVVDPRGGLTLRVDAGAGSNCTDAGITGVQLALTRIGEGCVAATFEIAAGGTLPGSSYTTSCETPAPHACIEDDQQITVAPTLAAGTYQLAITGFVGMDACYTSQPQFVIPAGGATEDLGVQELELECPP